MSHQLLDDFREIAQFVGWTRDDFSRVRRAAAVVREQFPRIIDDFYCELLRHDEPRQVLSGGDEQLASLRRSLRDWLEALFTHDFDEAFVAERWKVGRRHVEIGLNRMWLGAAFGRLRSSLIAAIQTRGSANPAELAATIQSLCRRLDLDLALIEFAYQTEYIDQRKTLREQVLEQHVAALGRILDQSMNEIYIFDEESLQFVYVNHGARRNLGYSMDQLRSMTPLDLKTGHSPEGFAALLESLTSGRQDRLQFETSHRRHDGTRYPVEVHLQLGELDNRCVVVAIILDVTERKRASQRSLQDQRLVAIGQTITGLAHESRNAFQRSQACLEMLELEVEDRPAALDLVQRIQVANDHLHHLYEEVRDYAAPITLERQACHLRHIWQATWRHLEVSRRDRDIELRETIAGPLEVDGDELALQQMFRNILENAIVACGQSGWIHVELAPDQIDHQPAVRVTVADSAKQWTPEACRRVFEPFFTTKTKGTGLGMAIAKRIVEAHSGQISLGSREGGGADVIITLPTGLVSATATSS